MAKKLSDIEKREILEFFYNGKTTQYIANKFSCTNLTIVRNLKKLIGEEKFKQLTKKINQSFQILIKKKRKFLIKKIRNLTKILEKKKFQSHHLWR